MRLHAIADVVAHGFTQDYDAAIAIAGGIFDHSNADVAEAPRAPDRNAGFAGIFDCSDRVPIDGFERNVEKLHACVSFGAS